MVGCYTLFRVVTSNNELWLDHRFGSSTLDEIIQTVRYQLRLISLVDDYAGS